MICWRRKIPRWWTILISSSMLSRREILEVLAAATRNSVPPKAPWNERIKPNLMIRQLKSIILNTMEDLPSRWRALNSTQFQIPQERAKLLLWGPSYVGWSAVIKNSALSSASINKPFRNVTHSIFNNNTKIPKIKNSSSYSSIKFNYYSTKTTISFTHKPTRTNKFINS